MTKTSGADLATKPRKPRKVTINSAKRRPKNQGSREKTQAERDGEALAAKVLTSWIAGDTILETAEKLGVSDSTVWRIRNECPDELLQFVEIAKAEKITALVEKNLEENLLAMNRIVKVTEDEAWIKAQRAPELATLYGVINDKTVRILAAIERANDRARMEQRGPVREFEDTGSIKGPAEAPIGA